MNDGGFIANLEQWFADTLAALQNEGANVFDTADVWKHQVGGVSGGMEAFQRHTPFAFVAYHGDESAREGGHDLREIPTIRILVGVYNDKPGVARIGDATHLGVSRIRDLIIAAFESKTPDGDLGCDEIYYMGAVPVLDAEKHYAVEMVFEVSKMNPNR